MRIIACWQEFKKFPRRRKKRKLHKLDFESSLDQDHPLLARSMLHGHQIIKRRSNIRGEGEEGEEEEKEDGQEEEEEEQQQE